MMQASPLFQTVPSDIWERIFVHLADEPNDLKTIKATCRFYNKLTKGYVLQAQKWMGEYGRFQVFAELYRSSPELLVFELVDNLLKQNAYLPKLFIEFAYENQAQVKLPPGTVEIFLATGFKSFKNQLMIQEFQAGDVLDPESGRVLEKDDVEFMRSVKDEICDTKLVQGLVKKNYFTPSLFHLYPDTNWDTIWDVIAAVSIDDPKLGYLLASNSGSSISSANREVFHRVALSKRVNKNILVDMVNAQFKFSDDVILLTLSDRAIIDNHNTCNILKDSVLEITAFATTALSRLFTKNTKEAFENFHFLIDEFDLADHLVEEVFAADEKSILKFSANRKYRLPMKTRFGLAHHGMNLKFLNKIRERYGNNHRFVKYCVMDLIIGGAVGFTPPSDERFKRRQSVSAFLNGWSKKEPIPELDDDAELASEAAIKSLLEEKLWVDAEIIPSVAATVLESRAPSQRFVFYMAKVESFLYDSKKSTREPWIAAFKEILENPEWKSILEPEVAAPQGRRLSKRLSFSQLSTAVSESVKSFDPKTKELRRFYSSIEELARELEAEGPSSPFNKESPLLMRTEDTVAVETKIENIIESVVSKAESEIHDRDAQPRSSIIVSDDVQMEDIKTLSLNTKSISTPFNLWNIELHNPIDYQPQTPGVYMTKCGHVKATMETVLEAIKNKRKAAEEEEKTLEALLLQNFLENTRDEKIKLLEKLKTEICYISSDLNNVQDSIENQMPAQVPETGAPSAARKRVHLDLDSAEAESENNESPISFIKPNIQLAQKRYNSRIHHHIKDLQENYFTWRKKGTQLLIEANVDNSSDNSANINEFSSTLVNCSKYSRFKTLATVKYVDSYYNYSLSIVSSIEFDKDDEYFATAGVTKKIKIFNYETVVSDFGGISSRFISRKSSHVSENDSLHDRLGDRNRIPRYPEREIPCESKIRYAFLI
ncbi:RING finger and WD repeat domain-containing protein 2 [Terramyces sp. JEL0728]|nr:RING finger and WD repeat domain-containing protein 2 [Terramyces sp. JEL0728]